MSGGRKYASADRMIGNAVERMLDERFDHPLSYIMVRTDTVPWNAKHHPYHSRTRILAAATGGGPEYNAQLDAIHTWVREELDDVIESGVVRSGGEGAWPGVKNPEDLRPQVWFYRPRDW